jgi:CheY-like chemotaxis protein
MGSFTGRARTGFERPPVLRSSSFQTLYLMFRPVPRPLPQGPGRASFDRPLRQGEVVKSPKKILAIDDEPDVLSFLELVLIKSGYLTETATNGTDGLIKAHVEGPDLILLDIMMEDMDGWETLRLLKLDEACRDIPVIILSARAEPKDKIRALQEGAIDYIIKPFPVVESLEKVRAILSADDEDPQVET